MKSIFIVFPKSPAAGQERKLNERTFYKKHIKLSYQLISAAPSVTLCGQEKEDSFLQENCPPNVTLWHGEESEEEISVFSLFVVLFHGRAVSSQWKQSYSCWLPPLCMRQREMTACCRGTVLFTRNHWNSLILALNKQARKQQQETVRCVRNGGEQPRHNWWASLQLRSACGPCSQPAWPGSCSEVFTPRTK